MTEELWVNPFKEANKLYDVGAYPDAFRFANEAAEFIEKDYVLILRKRMWSAYHVGFKEEVKRAEMYEIARKDARLVLATSNDLRIRNSAIKLLIILPDEDVRRLCSVGIRELSLSNLSSQEKEDLKGELRNSLGLEVKKSYPDKAIHIFTDAYETVSKGTTLTGHFKHNAGTCWLEMANIEKDNMKKMAYLTHALDNLQQALKEYPANQLAHRKTVEEKIKDIKNKTKEINNKIEEREKIEKAFEEAEPP